MSELVYLPVSQLYPHPDNPRKNVDDLEELAASIKANGVLQNLTVVLRTEPIKTSEDAKLAEINMQAEENLYLQKVKMHLIDKGYRAIGGYTVIIGHRRLAAAKLAGIEKLPCTVVEMSPREQVQTMLLENMQRKDLKVYEEAQGFQMLLDFGDTVEEVSDKSGFSATTIRRRVKLTELDQQTLKKVVDERQISLSDFEELAKIEDIKKRNEVLEKIGTRDFEYAVNSTIRDQNIAKNLPAVQAAVKNLKAKKIRSSDTYGSDYDKIEVFKISEWDKEAAKFPAESKEPLFYVLDERWGEVTLYKKHKRVRNVEKKSPEQLAEEKNIRERWNYIRKQSEVFHELRKEFIENFKVTTKNKMLVLQGAVIGGLYGDLCYNGCNRSEVFKILEKEDSYSERDKKILEALSNVKPEDYAKLVWCMFNDDERCKVIGGYEGNFPKYDPVYKIIAVYDWLKTLGYKMSEAEENLVYGKDKVYEKDSEQFDAAADSGEEAD